MSCKCSRREAKALRLAPHTGRTHRLTQWFDTRSWHGELVGHWGVKLCRASRDRHLHSRWGGHDGLGRRWRRC
eukprot:5380260-Prymnesium_polylepis.1